MESTYYNVAAPASYGGLNKFKPKGYTKKEVREWLQFQDICPPISHIVLKNFINISLIIQECSEEILIKLAIVLKISKSS
jgi:hypothetical protein